VKLELEMNKSILLTQLGSIKASQKKDIDNLQQNEKTILSLKTSLDISGIYCVKLCILL
jgi:hypothetical protein